MEESIKELLGQIQDYVKTLEDVQAKIMMAIRDVMELVEDL